MKARRVPVASVRWHELVRGFSGSRTEVRDLVDYCRVFSAEDVIRWALSAYQQSVRETLASEGAWVEAGVPWSSPKQFADSFTHIFERRVWDACARSDRYREVEAWTEKEVRLFVAPREHELPLCGNVDLPVESAGAANAT